MPAVAAASPAPTVEPTVETVWTKCEKDEITNPTMQVKG